MIAESARLVIREFEVDDSASLMNVFGDEEVMRYGDGVKTLEWVEYTIREWRKDYCERGYGKWAVVTQDGSQLLGYCGLENLDMDGKQEVAIGYRLARPYWGQGYASEAVIAVRDFGLNALGLKRLVATIDPSNTASIRVVQKAGFVYEKDVMFEGYSHPDYVYTFER